MISWIPTILFVLASLHTSRHAITALPDWVTQDIIDMVQDDKDRCMQEHGTTQDKIDQVNDGNIINERSLTCYMNCLLESFGVIDEDTGDFESEMLLGFFPEEIQAKGRDVLLSCGKESGADKCDRIYNIAACIHGKNPDLWFML